MWPFKSKKSPPSRENQENLEGDEDLAEEIEEKEQNQNDNGHQQSNQNGVDNAEEKEEIQDVHPDHDESFETFSFVDMKDGTFQPNNQRLDFLNRDRLMYDISFYEFVSDYEKTKIPPNFEKRDGDFRFTSRHPQHNTHYLRRRKHSAPGSAVPDKEKKKWSLDNEGNPLVTGDLRDKIAKSFKSATGSEEMALTPCCVCSGLLFQ